MTETLTIRGLHSDDWEAVYVLWNQRDIILDTFELPFTTEEAFREYFSNPPASTHVLVAEIGMPSGRKRISGAAWLEVQARRRRHTGRLSLILHSDYHGTETETELLKAVFDLADNWLGLLRIETIVFAACTYLAGLYEQYGFVREAVLRRYAIREGVYGDAWLLARLHGTAPQAPRKQERRPRRKTARPAITVRAQAMDDWEDFVAIRNCKNVIYHTLQVPYMSPDAVRDRLENPPANFYGLAAEVDKKIVGALGLHLRVGRRAHSASLGMMVHSDYQGIGVGSALLAAVIDLAENWLNISRIELEVYTDNKVGLALYKKFGFEIEGTLHTQAFRAGGFVDAYIMARIKEDTYE